MACLTTIVKSHFITARAAARHMVNQKSDVIVFVTGSPALPRVPGATAIGAAFGAIENRTGNLAFEVSPSGVRVVCLRTERHRQGSGSLPILGDNRIGVNQGRIRRRARPGGLLNYYYREAA